MYFSSRADAGKELAKDLSEYRFEDTSVVALTAGSVPVALEVSKYLLTPLSMYVSRGVDLPSAHKIPPIGEIDPEGKFSYSDSYKAGVREELEIEFRAYLDAEKSRKFHDINKIVSHTGVTDFEVMRERVVLVVVDAMSQASHLESFVAYVKPVKIKKLITATVIATVNMIDKMRLMADDFVCLSVVDNFISSDHYFSEEPEVDEEKALDIIGSGGF